MAAVGSESQSMNGEHDSAKEVANAVAAHEKRGYRSDLPSPHGGLTLSDIYRMAARASTLVKPLGAHTSAKEVAMDVTGKGKSGYGSDLSQPGYKTTPPLDCVLAVSQGALNAEMLRYLDEQQFQEVSMCFMTNLDSEKLHTVSLEHVKSTTGVNPFEVQNDAQSPDKDFDPLLKTPVGTDAKGRDLYFEGAIKYIGGLPSTPELPPIVVLPEQMDGRIQYNMTFAELQIVGFNHIKIKKYINIRQSESPHPWVFSFDMDFLESPVAASHSGVPAEVIERYKQLLEDAGAGAFGLARLHLLISTAALQAEPTISGIADNFEPTWKLMSKPLVSGYLDLLKKHGGPIFSYAFTTEEAVPVKACLPMTELSYVAAPHHAPTGESNSPTGDQLSCLAYLCTAKLGAHDSPPAVAFPWNWVVADDYKQIAGVVSIKREHFVDFLRASLGAPINNICFNNYVSVDESFGSLSLNAYFLQAPSDGNRWVALLEPPVVKGLGLKVLEMQFASEAHAEGSATQANTKFTAKNTLDGGVYFDSTRVVIELHATNYLCLWHNDLLQPATILNGNYYDKTFRYELDLMVSSYGTIRVSKPNPVVVDMSVPFKPDFNTKSLFVNFDEIVDYVRRACPPALSRVQWRAWRRRPRYPPATMSQVDRVSLRLNESLDTGLDGLANEMYYKVNSFNRFVYPGSGSFAFHDVFFSKTCDLVSQLKYSSSLMKTRLAKAHGLTATPVTEHVLANKTSLVFGRRRLRVSSSDYAD